MTAGTCAAGAPPADPRALLRAAFDEAVRAVHPRSCMAGAIPPPPAGRTVVIAIGKAALTMAEAVTGAATGPASGVVVAPRGQVRAAGHVLPGLEVLEAGHPIPDVTSERAAARVLGWLQGLRPEDRVLALVSGGGSALLAQPAPGLTLAHKQEISRQLLTAGATITEINCVRKKLSSIKGGRLALAAQPAEVRLLAISDVPGDDITMIASGPFSPDATTLADARAVMARYDCLPGEAVRRFLADSVHETPKPGHPAFERVTARICARSADALHAAAGVLQRSGFEPLLMDDAVNESAQVLAARHARLARQHAESGRCVALVTGGETTVRVTDYSGRGGRNTHYLLALALELRGCRGVWALAADSDGIDGTQDNAGAVVTPDCLARAACLGLDPAALLARSRAWDFFAALDDLVVTGPTGTNTNDLRIVLVNGSSRAAPVG